MWQYWPIQGSWEKRKTVIQMNLIAWLSIACISYLPRQYPESLRQPPDTSKTPSRHPTDTPNLGKFWPSQGHWEKRKQLLRMSLMGCLKSACTSYPSPDIIQSQPPDTSHNPQSNMIFLTKPLQGFNWWKCIILLFYWMFINCLCINPTPTLSGVTHATLRHLSDTFQTPQNTDQLISGPHPPPPSPPTLPTTLPINPKINKN